MVMGLQDLSWKRFYYCQQLARMHFTSVTRYGRPNSQLLKKYNESFNPCYTGANMLPVEKCYIEKRKIAAQRGETNQTLLDHS